MADIRPSRIWTRQPPGSVWVNWGNSLTNRLTSLTHAPLRYEAISGRAATTSGPFQTLSTSSYGKSYLARYYNRSSAQSQDSWSTSGTTGDLTFFMFGNLTAFSGAGNQELCRLTSSTNNIVGFFEVSNNAVNLVVNPVGVSGSSISFGSSSISNQARAYFGRVKGTTLTAWVDGAQFGSSVTLAGTDFSSIANIINGSTGFLSQPTGVILISAYWKRALDAAEIRALTTNPWQLFAPQTQISYFFPTSTGQSNMFMMF